MMWCVKVQYRDGGYPDCYQRYTVADAAAIYNRIRAEGRCNGRRVLSVEMFTARGSNRA
jgi:hypothetical protein